MQHVEARWMKATSSGRHHARRPGSEAFTLCGRLLDLPLLDAGMEPVSPPCKVCLHKWVEMAGRIPEFASVKGKTWPQDFHTDEQPRRKMREYSGPLFGDKK